MLWEHYGSKGLKRPVSSWRPPGAAAAAQASRTEAGISRHYNDFKVAVKRKRAGQKGATGSRARQPLQPQNAQAETAAQRERAQHTAAAAPGGDLSQVSRQQILGRKHVGDVLGGSAPKHMNMDEAFAFVEAAAYYGMADLLVAAPRYFHPLLQETGPTSVCPICC